MSPIRVQDDDTYPPITVLLSQDHQHLSLREAQLVVVVGLAVVQRLNPPARRASRLVDTKQSESENAATNRD